MAIQAKKQSPWFAVLLIAAAVVLWALDKRKEFTGQESGPTRKEASPSSPRPPSTPAPSANPDRKSPAPKTGSAATRQGRYEVYRNCTLAADKTNDGDSFRVLLPDGRREILRLYFVDTPESDFKSYRNGENNHERIRDQAAYFGISAEQAVAIGQEGKHFTLDLLGKRPFTIYTEWDSPFHDQRYHAFIEVSDGGRQRWLDELLVEKGFARLKTKPADLPDGTKADEHRRYLTELQAGARKRQAGGWMK